MVLNRIRALAVATLLVTLLAPLLASADEPKDLARQHFDRGVELFEDEAWDAALVEFSESRALYPTRNATKNAAICLRMLHRYDEALDLYEALLREFPDLSADSKSLAEKEIQSLQQFVGRIALTGGEAGATIVIDSRSRGTLPSPPIRAAIGAHVVRVTKDGFMPFETNVTVTAGQTQPVAVELRPLTQSGRLRIVEASGIAVTVVVDNVAVGKTPWEGALSVGDHTVFLRGDGKLATAPVRAPITLGQLTALTLAVEELDCALRVQPSPTTANVAIDGVVVGNGTWEGRLRPGPHRIEVGDDGYLAAIRDVTITKGERKIVAVELERDPTASLTYREAEAARKAWLARRGSTFTFELRGQGNVLVLPHTNEISGYVVEGQFNQFNGVPYRTDNRRPTDYFGGGGAGGVGVRVAYLFLALPDPSRSGLWSGLRVGTGVDVSFGYAFAKGSVVTVSDTSKPDQPETTTKYEGGAWGGTFIFNVPVVVGYQLGIGSFRGNDWKGVVLGAAYAPTFTVIKPTRFDATTTLNLAGFEVSADFLDQPLDSKRMTPHPRVFIYLLPPIGDRPFLLSIGGGAAFY